MVFGDCEHIPCVLVVDDNAVISNLLCRLLPRVGFGVVAVDSGREGARLLAADPAKFDLALIDVEMPGLDGPATARLLRLIKPGLVCCLMGGGNYDDPEGLLGGEVANFVSKPFRPDGLQKSLRSALEKAHELVGR